MLKKMFLVGFVVVGVIVTIWIMTASYDGIRAMIGIAQADPSLSGPAGGNYTAYNAALGASPWWLFFIPVVVGGVTIVMVLRAPERR